MHPIKFIRPACFILVACLALPVPPARAEDKPTPEPQGAPRGFIPNRETISIEFSGGPLSKLVASLNGDKNTRLSIIQSAGLDPVLPAFSVHEVRIDATIIALGRLLEPQGYILNPTGPNLAVLTKLERHGGQAFASIQLERLIGTWSAEDIIATIRAGCEFANEDGKLPSTLRFKYHPGTKLLFVAGTEQEVDVAQRVFGSLRERPDKAGTPAPEKK